MFSIGSLSSTSLATVTPSLVTVGEPNFLSMTTFLPLGPRVTLTASARWSTPFLSLARASVLKRSSFAAMSDLLKGSEGPRRPFYVGLADLGQDVGSLDDDHFILTQLERRAAVLPVDHAVADLEIDRHPLALLHTTRADGDDLTLGGLFLRGVRDVQPAAHGLCLIRRHDYHTIFQRLKFEIGLGLGSSRHRYDLHYRIGWTI